MPQRWLPPPPQTYKINFDGAVFKDLMAGGLRVIIRDHRGAFVAGCTRKIVDTENAEYLELLAIKEACLFAEHRGLRDFVLEGDTLGIIKELNRSNRNDSYLGVIVEEVPEMLLRLDVVDIRWVKRDANVSAHVFTQYARNILSFVSWDFQTPSFACSALVSDAQCHY